MKTQDSSKNFLSVAHAILGPHIDMGPTAQQAKETLPAKETTLSLDDIRQILGEQGYALQARSNIVRLTGLRGPTYAYAYKALRGGHKGPSRSLGKLEDVSKLDAMGLIALVEARFAEEPRR
jgi:hypothetical protein